MPFLYDNIKTLRENGLDAEIPQFLIDNLNPAIKLREYQEAAIKSFLVYFRSNYSKNKQTHLLFHMATGSGKTVIMAMTIFYYYNLGYRNFLFFTNRSNIVDKTIDNFTNKTSSKYLFNDTININGRTIKVNNVNNFEDANSDAINICFNTVQGVHDSLSLIKEGSLTIEDFENKKIVLIADEAHHLNTTTKADKEENEDNATWEDTVNKLFFANKDNVLLEFTATCDIGDDKVKDKYLDKIVYNFDLKEFRKAGYTKEFYNFSSNTDLWTRTLQALILSEYRKLVFEKHNVSIKPVVLLKSQKIKESNAFYLEFYNRLSRLSINELESIKTNNNNDLLKNAFDFFKSCSLDFDELIALIQSDFAQENSVNMNELNDENARIVNNLDERDNHYRVIFIVDKLTEGWDVLSLFDIVRLYETRQSGKGKVSKYTIQEAQLIGRGARYCPFKFEQNQEKDKRKYSSYDNPLAICESLLYHAQSDARYIAEIRKALKETGLVDSSDKVKVIYRVKDSFKKTKVYKEGNVFCNKQIVIDRKSVTSLPGHIRTHGVTYRCVTGALSSQKLFDDSKPNEVVEFKDLPIVRLKNIPFNILYKAYRCFSATLSFDKIKVQFPNLKSAKEFLTSSNYLGDFPITFSSINSEKPKTVDKLNACKKVLNFVSDYIQKIETSYAGTKEFDAIRICKIFVDVPRNYTRDEDDESWGGGVSQSSPLVKSEYRIDLSDKDWYVYNDNFGTSEEKKFVKYFSTKIDSLRKMFSGIYLIRNEQKLALYSFEDGKKFEPDYVLILTKQRSDPTANDIYVCMYIEPKGQHLLEHDAWKNTFLNEIKTRATARVLFKDDNDYNIWGMPFYNETMTKDEFEKQFNEYLDFINKLNAKH